MIVLVLPNTVNDTTLLDQARNGDKVAIAEIYRLYVDSIYQFCRLRLSDPQQAEDITSTVFTRFIKALADGKGPREHLRGWLFQVARNAIHDAYGQRTPLPIEAIEHWAQGDEANPEYSVFQAIDTDILRQHIMMLSPDQQDVIFMRFAQQLSIHETADVLGKNPNTVKALQFRAVNRLRDLLTKTGMKSS